jgi:hypothetical protein
LRGGGGREYEREGEGWGGGRPGPRSRGEAEERKTRYIDTNAKKHYYGAKRKRIMMGR